MFLALSLYICVAPAGAFRLSKVSGKVTSACSDVQWNYTSLKGGEAGTQYSYRCTHFDFDRAFTRENEQKDPNYEHRILTCEDGAWKSSHCCHGYAENSCMGKGTCFAGPDGLRGPKFGYSTVRGDAPVGELGDIAYARCPNTANVALVDGSPNHQVAFECTSDGWNYKSHCCDGFLNNSCESVSTSEKCPKINWMGKVWSGGPEGARHKIDCVGVNGLDPYVRVNRMKEPLFGYEIIECDGEQWNPSHCCEGACRERTRPPSSPVCFAQRNGLRDVRFGIADAPTGNIGDETYMDCPEKKRIERSGVAQVIFQCTDHGWQYKSDNC